MKLYAFMFMGNFRPEHTATWDNPDMRTSIFTVGSFEEGKAVVEKLYQEGYGALELCGAFTKEMADAYAEMTNKEMAIGYMVHDPELDPAFEKFFAG